VATQYYSAVNEHFVIIIIMINDVLDYEIYISYSTRHYFYVQPQSFGGHISLFAISIIMFTLSLYYFFGS